MFIMNKLFLIVVILFVASAVEAQEALYKKGTLVKGKKVTYQVREMKHSYLLVVRNMDNPDTTLRPIPRRGGDMPDQIRDITSQVAVIIHDCLTPEELKKLGDAKECVFVYLRMDRKKHKLLQVTGFGFGPNEIDKYRLDPYDGFWLNLAPDRLYAIEQAIVKKVEVPKQIQLTFLTDDFMVLLSNEQIVKSEEMKIKGMKARDRWKANPKLDKRIVSPGVRPIEL